MENIKLFEMNGKSFFLVTQSFDFFSTATVQSKCPRVCKSLTQNGSFLKSEANMAT